MPAEVPFFDTSYVYSNDRHFLAAAPIFGLRGVDVIRAVARAAADEG